jgi:hypothetical protein
MIKYVTYATFASWHADLRKEIKEKLIKSGAKYSEKDWLQLTNRLTRKHIGFEFSSSENGKDLYHNALRHRPEPAKVKESVIKINIINQRKFTLFMFKFSKKFEFIDSKHIMYM